MRFKGKWRGLVAGRIGNFRAIRARLTRTTMIRSRREKNHVLSDIFRYAVFLVVLCAMNIMSLQKIAIAFGGPPVLNDVTFSVEKGDRACITGRNGEGKSTLLKIMAGILEPDHGEIATAPNLRIAYLSQDVPGDRQGSAETACEHELHNARNVSRVREFLTRLGVNPEQPFNSLSGGQRRRALLAAEFLGVLPVVLDRLLDLLPACLHLRFLLFFFLFKSLLDVFRQNHIPNGVSV